MAKNSINLKNQIMKNNNFNTPLLLFIIVLINLPSALPGQIYFHEKLDFRNYLQEGPIWNRDELKGYYTCNKIDNNGSGTEYELKLLDLDFNLLGSDKFSVSKDAILLQVILLGDQIVVKFGDPKKRLFNFRVYNQEAKLLFKKEREADKWEFQAVGGAKVLTAPITTSLYPLSDGSFLEFCVKAKKNRIGYEIKNFSQDLSKDKWSFLSNPDQKQDVYAAYLGGNEDLLLILTSKSEVFRRVLGVSMYLIALNPENGEKVFETKITDDKFEYVPTKAFFKDDGTQKISLVGQYFERGEKRYHDYKSKGLFYKTFDYEGNEINDSKINWEKDVQKHSFSLEGKEKLFLHDIFENEEGEMFVIGEVYSNERLHRYQGSDVSKTRIDVSPERLVTFHYSSKIELIAVHEIQKEGNHKFFHTNPLFSINKGMVIKAGGGFDYVLTHLHEKDNSFTIAYLDFKEPDGEKRKKYLLGLSTYSNGEFSNKEVDLNAKNHNELPRVLPGKPGYIAVFDYDENTKILDTRLERLRE
ncbi:MAG: hypothetical protein DWQ02_02335 [Bacteroidetes bacterium]|nr:MAG: hypothetical protein DWQ02_02335 [Bacteroidota bacterium]